MNQVATATAIDIPQFVTAQPTKLLLMRTPAPDSLLTRTLSIFVCHASDLLTDHMPHGDGLIAWNFLRGMADRGHNIHVAATRVEVKGRIPANLHIHMLPLRGTRAMRRIDYMIRMRMLFERLQRTIPFDAVAQMNPVFTGVSLAMLGSGVPLVLGTYVASWPTEEVAAAASPEGVPAKAWVKDAMAFTQQFAAERMFLTSPIALTRVPFPAINGHKVRYVKHGVNSEVFQPAADFDSEARLAAEQAQPTVLFVANVVKRKGIEPLVRAWVHVQAAMPQARLTVAGDGPDLPFMKQLATELGVLDSIHFAGGMQQKALPRLFQEHAIYVLPSFGEPYGGTLLEAMACGRPVVITNAGGLPEMVTEQGSVRVPVRDADALAKGILALLRDPQRRRAAAYANLQTIADTMTWSRVLDQLETHYGELLGVPVITGQRVTAG